MRLYHGTVDFYADQIRLPNGKRAVREYLGHPGAVAVLPFLSPHKILLVRQYRYPVRRITYEIPAGKLDPGESLRTCAARELAEEAGVIARKMKPLLSYWPTPAFSNEILHLYFAQGLRRNTVKGASAPQPDEDEFLQPVQVPYLLALRWVFEGKIRDSKTAIALLAYEFKKKRNRRPHYTKRTRSQ
ncbi:MAG: NUDIX hydrolase [Elusimicrobia bacterium]|nr:NUDIX hydrolase [Elusimicrobiota bacterium]